MENSTTHFNIKQRKVVHLLIATFLAASVMFFLTIPYSVHAEETAEEEETISSPTKTSSNKVTEKASTINEEESNLEEESHEEESHSEAVESEDNDSYSENEEVDSNENEQEEAIKDSENADNEENDEDFDESEEDEAQENDENSDSDKEDDATEDEEDTEADSDKDNEKTEESDEDADIENPEDNDADSEVDSDEDDVDKDTEDNDVESEDKEDKDEIIESEDKEKSENTEKEKDEKKNQKESDSGEISLHSAKEKGTIKKGDRDKRVIKMKKDLEKLGFKVPGNGTSLFGTKTESKIKEFQKYYGLDVTGTFDNSTEKVLNKQSTSPLQKGKKHKDTKKLKKDLKKLGFKVPGNGTTLYGAKTKAKVKSLQKYYKLKVNGIADEVTLNKIKSILNSPLQKGEKHKDTKKLKKDLKKLGFKVPGNGTTLYGTKTETKVKALQKHYSLIINGIADEITLNKIKSVLKTPLQNGKKHKDTKKLKVDLAKIGYAVPGNGTTLYGTKTTASVKSFQKDNKLPVSGIADEVTLKKIATIVKQAKKKVIYLDAGHGGTDPGASGHGLKEKDLVLDIAKRTRDKLKAAGFTVIMSRSTDKTVKLDERTKEANDVKADIFVSIHANSFNGTASGIETWKMSQGPKAKESNTLASYLQNEIIKKTKGKDRGVKDGNLHVNRESKMPSSLVEVGFIDNKSEVNNLKKASYKNKIATGITNGIKKFFNMI